MGSDRGRAPAGGWTALQGRLAARLLRVLGATWRVRVVGDDTARDGGLGALWHRDLLLGAWFFRDVGAAVCVSRSRDGDRIAAVLPHLGFGEAARGSSSRGGAAALRRLGRALAAGVPVGIPTDGPRGPAGRSKPGVAVLARGSGVPITPVAFAARPRLQLRSWDRTVLPLPFARVECRFGEPIAVPADADPAREERACRELDGCLERLSADLPRARPGRVALPGRRGPGSHPARLGDRRRA